MRSRHEHAPRPQRSRWNASPFSAGLGIAGVLVGLCAWTVVGSGATAQELIDASHAAVDKDTAVAWYTAQTIGIEGRGWDDTQSPFDRLPARAADAVRPPVWTLSKHTAGLCLRFVSDTDAVHVRWQLTSNNLAMPHMPATGVSGVDLYVRTDQGWRWLANGRPTSATNQTRLAHGLPTAEREYLLYLPLYNGVVSLEVGVGVHAKIWRKTWPPTLAKPIVFWGTSITQGGCASRPGMVHTAILGRRLERPVVNLGFSGNGKLEQEVARLVAELDAAVFVLDCLPNLSAEELAPRVDPVLDILRAKHPTTPIVLVEDRTYADAFLIDSRRQRNQTSRDVLSAAYRRRVDGGDRYLHYLPGDGLLGDDGDDTVDGSHPTDLGFWRQANAFEKVLRPLLTTEGTLNP